MGSFNIRYKKFVNVGTDNTAPSPEKPTCVTCVTECREIIQILTILGDKIMPTLKQDYTLAIITT